MFTVLFLCSVFSLGHSIPEPSRANFGDIYDLPTVGDLKVGFWADGVIPYEISVESRRGISEGEVKRAMAEISTRTCIRFVPRSTETDYVVVQSATPYDCYAHLGRKGGRQEVNLGTHCQYSGVGHAVHMLLHTVGLIHEEMRPDRDEFVKINWENVKPRAKNHLKIGSHPVDRFGLAYDYNSIMHSTKNVYEEAVGDVTIRTINPENANIGQLNGLSPLDVEKINKLYSC